MSPTEGAPAQPDPDRAAGWWMDGDAEEPGPASGPAPDWPDEAAGRLSDRDRLRAAELQLVHALLLHLSDQEGLGSQARIDRAVQAIRQLPPGTTAEETKAVRRVERPRRRVGLLARWAVAASLLAAASWFYLSTSNPALAALDRIVQAMDDPVDRTYEISVEPADHPAPRGPGRKPPPRGDGHPPPENPRPGLDNAILYARGADQTVLYRSTPGGRWVISGSNRRENWLIRPDRPVLVSSDPKAFRIPMPENLATIPLVDIRLSLTSLRHGYELEELPPEGLDDGSSTLWRHLRARKIVPATKGPNAVSIWFHPTTSLIGRVDFEQVHMQGRPEPRQMTISLVSTEPLPANWFEHAAHHAPDAVLEQVAP